MKLLLATVFAAALGTLAVAHSKINTTVPADGAQLASPPQMINLSFAKKIRLTKVEVSISGGEELSLDLSQHKSFATQFDLPLPSQAKGPYTIEWRGLSQDGHVMQGSFTFEVN
ncbi:MAG: copper resistance CopC family protein [Planktomarina sp.]